VPLYKKLGLKKKYWSPVSSADFRNADPAVLRALSHPKKLEDTAIYQHSDEATRQSLRAFEETGYAILKGYVAPEVCDNITAEVDRRLNDGSLKFKYGNKIMFAIKKSRQMRETGTSPALMELCSSLIGGEAKLFQSINFIMGSEQHTHSDSIHMTTFPLGGLLGAWVALEDIGPEQGALHYYPGSHLLPYYLNSDFGNEGSCFLTGHNDYAQYERMLAAKMKENRLEKQIFSARKGDVLLWHANLFHGGEPHTDKTKTRKSMVFHYFDVNCICYHEMTQRPALIGME